MEPQPPAAAAPAGRRPQLAAGLGLWLVLAIAASALWPGRTGGFLFDDYPNLAGLEALKSDPGRDQVLQFLANGIASPLGRPLSLASFAAQMHDWPGHPEAFIRANILLHLLAAALLFWWLLRLARLMQLPPTAALTVPLAATALWAWAPIQVTSVLYVVQRMTELSALCVFLGLLLYLTGRERAAQGRGGGLWWMSAGMAVGAGLGTLAKENALLMPLLVAVLECTLLARVPRPASWGRWAIAFIGVPAAVVLGYLLWIVLDPAAVYAGREFTLAQRLLSEPRILFQYLHQLLLPWPSAMRLWYDDFTVSTGLFQPWTTALALAGWIAALALAWRWRARAPLPAFAVLWFAASHLLESTVLPLELVFEHRNYQASAGIWFALAAGGHALLQRASSDLVRAAGGVLAIAYVALLAGVTWQVASLWGQPFAMTVWMAERLPESRRARAELVGALLQRGHGAEAAAIAGEAAARWPDDAGFPLLVLQVSCQAPDIPHPDFADLQRRVTDAGRNVNGVVHHLDGVLSLVELDHCPVGLPGPLSALTGAAVHNPGLRGQRQNRLLLHARALRLEGRGAEAREAYDRAIDAAPWMVLVLHGAIAAIDAGDLAGARDYLRRAEDDPRIRAADRWAHRTDVARLRELLDGAGTAPPSR
jgi:hypothetical protein